MTRAVTSLWIGWLIIWYVAAINVKRSRVRDTVLSHLIQVGVSGAVFVLLYPQMHLGWADTWFVGNTYAAQVLGTFLTALGLGFCLWARIYLGRNWSGAVRISEDHELIRSGPYARIRHPIYSGLLLAILGTAVVLGRWRGIAALMVAIVGFAYKAKREERLLAQEFGSAFEEHRRRTGFFIPRLPFGF
jgi:protein-S-isoprenylcysteine O-methyltransferase Ste14